MSAGEPAAASTSHQDPRMQRLQRRVEVLDTEIAALTASIDTAKDKLHNEQDPVKAERLDRLLRKDMCSRDRLFDDRADLERQLAGGSQVSTSDDVVIAINGLAAKQDALCLLLKQRLGPPAFKVAAAFAMSAFWYILTFGLAASPRAKVQMAKLSVGMGLYTALVAAVLLWQWYSGSFKSPFYSTFSPAAWPGAAMLLTGLLAQYEDKIQERPFPDPLISIKSWLYDSNEVNEDMNADGRSAQEMSALLAPEVVRSA